MSHFSFNAKADQEKTLRNHWRDFYETFGMDGTGFLTAPLPSVSSESHWIIGIAAGLTIASSIDIARLFFPVSAYRENIDQVTVHARQPCESYFVAFSRKNDACEPLDGTEARSCKSERPQPEGITVTERNVLQAHSFLETGTLLDQEGFTVCRGSLDTAVERFPCTCSTDDGRYIVWWDRPIRLSREGPFLTRIAHTA
jgi:hypothetical protein